MVGVVEDSSRDRQGKRSWEHESDRPPQRTLAAGAGVPGFEVTFQHRPKRREPIPASRTPTPARRSVPVSVSRARKVSHRGDDKSSTAARQASLTTTRSGAPACSARVAPSAPPLEPLLDGRVERSREGAVGYDPRGQVAHARSYTHVGAVVAAAASRSSALGFAREPREARGRGGAAGAATVPRCCAGLRTRGNDEG